MAGDPEGRVLAGLTLLAIFAHPDDESVACGGTLARAADAGARVVLVCASRGERGQSSGVSPPRADLGAARACELAAAAKVLGIETVVQLDHPDGLVRWADREGLARAISAVIDRCAPDAVVTFGEDGFYWHADHIGVHEQTLEVVTALGDTAPPLYYVSLPRGVMRGLVSAAEARGYRKPGTTVFGIDADAFGAGAASPTLVVDVRPWIDRKLAALRCHRTQIGADNPFAWINEEDARRWLGFEYYRRAPLACGRAGVLERIGSAASITPRRNEPCTSTCLPSSGVHIAADAST